MKLRHITIALLTLLINTSLFAGVNLKNGNYYVSYTDVSMSTYISAFEDITRTYNSKSTEIGIFGYGWGSDIETRLFAYPDGTILIKENGSGANTYYKSQLALEDMLELMIDELIDETIAEGDLNNAPNEIIERRNKLLNNLEYRSRLWNKYVKKGLLEHVTDFPVDMEWSSHMRGNSNIVRTEEGFIRTIGNKIETFDNFGNLIKYDIGNGKYSILEYDGKRLSKLISADGKELIFTLNQDGYITSITSDAGNANYVYDGKKLIESTDAVGNVYKHAYDDRNNMTSITYSNGSMFKIEYEPKTSYVSKITERDGREIQYEYITYYNEDGSINDNHYATKVLKDGYNGKIENYYEYITGTKENGETYNKMIKTTVNGISTETHYDELCNNPLEITRGKNKTTFKYNNRCLLIEKLTTQGDSTYIKYHSKFDKIISVNKNNSITDFEYDSKGNLIKAEKSNGNWVELEYDEKGNIIKMLQEDKSLLFTYNSYGKPIVIELEGVGKINVTYDKYGDIESVKSDDGHEIALQVTQAFQSLLSLVKPAGVNLNM